MDHNIIIIGNGISSLLTSLAIAKLGINVDLYSEIENPRSTNLVTFLSRHSLDFLKNIDNQKFIFDQYQSIDEIECSYFDKQNDNESILDFVSKGDAYLGKIIPNNDLYNIFLSKVLNVPNINIHNDVITQIDNKKNLTVLKTNKNKEIKSDFVIFADSKNPIIKKTIFSNMITKEFNQRALSIQISM